MEISEIFYSIQGESTYSGLPCIFIRTARCNLNCSYCDTKYAEKTNLTLSPTEVIQHINTYTGTTLVEITGGEPLLQEDIYILFDILHQNNFQILLETNGSISLENIPSYVAKIVDIKTPGSGFPDSFLIENLKYINTNTDNLKIVLTSINDYEWMKEFLHNYNIIGQHVLISTIYEGLKPELIVKKILFDKLNVRFQLQIHKYILGIK